MRHILIHYGVDLGGVTMKYNIQGGSSKGGKPMNKEGYKDPTADRAIAHADHIPKHVRDVIEVLKKIASLAGFRIANIELEDKTTRKKFKYRK